MRTSSLVLVLLLSGCILGPRNTRELRVATTPAGVSSWFRTGDAVVEGELLAVTDTSFVVLEPQRVVEVAMTARTQCRFPPFHNATLRCHVLDDRSMARLRLLGRYHNDVPKAAMASLLAERGQSAVEVVR